MNKKEIGKKIVYASEMFVPFKYLQIFNLSTGSIRSSYNASHHSGLRTMNHETLIYLTTSWNWINLFVGYQKSFTCAD